MLAGHITTSGVEHDSAAVGIHDDDPQKESRRRVAAVLIRRGQKCRRRRSNKRSLAVVDRMLTRS